MTDTTYTPRFPVPKGACDCHYHIFGPATRFPPNPEIQHLMPDASAADNAKMRARVWHRAHGAGAGRRILPR